MNTTLRSRRSCYLLMGHIGSWPDDVALGNWIQTDPEKGWFVILRLYSPQQPFFDKSWRAGEIEPVG